MIRGCAIHASKCVASVAALTLLAVDAQALRYQEHPPWIRASGGLGWAGKAKVEVFEDVALDHGHRVDLWGLGVAVGAGYDFWVSSNLQLGLGATINYFDIGEMVVDDLVGPVDVKDAWFASTLLNFNLFF